MGELERILGEREGLRPEPSLEPALELREVEVRAASALELLPRVVEEGEAEVEEARGDGLALDEQMAFREVPAARADHERRHLLVEAIGLLRRLEGDRAAHSVVDVALALDDIGERRGERVLEVGHEHACARIERVDHHLPVDRARDLAPSIAEIGWRLGHLPVVLPQVAGLLEERWALAGVEPGLALSAALEQLEPRRVQLSVKKRDEVEGFARQHLLVRGGEDLDGRGGHAGVSSNCASSVEPRRARVDDSPPETASTTRSK